MDGQVTIVDLILNYEAGMGKHFIGYWVIEGD